MWEIVHKPDEQSLLRYLNGDLTGTVNLGPAAPANGGDVDTKTLVVDVGGGDQTVTFAPAKSRNWTLDEIIAAINAVVPGLASKYIFSSGSSVGSAAQRVTDIRLNIKHDPAATIKATSTALAELGFPAADTTQALIAKADVALAEHSVNPNGSHNWSILADV